jgi:hypothetical protein
MSVEYELAIGVVNAVWGINNVVSVEQFNGNVVKWRILLRNDSRRHYLDGDYRPCCHESCMNVADMKGTNA